MTSITIECREPGTQDWLAVNTLVANGKDALKTARQEAELRLVKWIAVDPDNEYRIKEEK